MGTNPKAIILAAGMGTRLKPLTLDYPKCLLKVGGKPLIARQIETLCHSGVEEICVVVGHLQERIREFLGDSVRFLEYPDFSKTNNLHTLWHVREELSEGFLCLFSDVLFTGETIGRLLQSSEDLCLAVDGARVLEGTMRVKLKEGRLAGVGSHIPVVEGSGTFIGIAKFSAQGAKALLKEMESMVSGHQQDYYTLALDNILRRGGHVGFVDISDQPWREIDTLEDLKAAEENFS